MDRTKDPNFWSVCVSRDVRIIVHRTRNSLLLCYIAHHDNAYQWAERRKLETHLRTGAAQLVEVREIVQEIAVPKYVDAVQDAVPKLPLLTDVPESDLLSYGVPPEWLDDVRNADEDSLLELVEPGFGRKRWEGQGLRIDKHDASGEGIGVSRCCSDGV